MNIQFKKGIFELCVVSLLAKKDCYGYELVSEISKSIFISEGTIYPLLRRLKNDKYIDSYLVDSDEGPARKYYKLTEAGDESRKKMLKDWRTIVKGVDVIIGKEDIDG